MHLTGNIALVARPNQEDFVKALIAEWRQKAFAQLMLDDKSLQAGGISMDEFKARVFQSMIDFEIEKNAMKQRITSMENQKLKAQDMSGFTFVCSTIHSAKGLEFDNVILLYDEGDARDEENKRMYYVGLTRAKGSEYVLAYGTNRGRAIRSAWESGQQGRCGENRPCRTLRVPRPAPAGNLGCPHRGGPGRTFA